MRINLFTRWIYIGICQIRQTQSHQFESSDWWNIGHGHYCIGADGYVFSHNNANANNKPQSFRFKKGDVLQFEFDLTISKLSVTKNTNERYETDIENGKTEMYAFCTYMCDRGDSVEMIDV